MQIMVHSNIVLFNSMLILYYDMINYHHDLLVLVARLRFVVKVSFDIGGIMDRVRVAMFKDNG